MTDLRQRIIDAAAELTTETGWSSVTMSRLAHRVGVSRQTIYNEIGSKPALAEAMVLDELVGFLTTVEVAFDEHPDDAAKAVRAAVRAVLERAESNPLLRAVVSTSQGGGAELLPLLSTQSDALRGAAREVLARRMAPHTAELTRRERATLIDMIVRVVLSHVMQPSGTPRSISADLAWTVERLLRT